MRQAASPAQSGWRNPFTSAESASAKLGTVVYRSRAVRPLSPPQLHDLTCAAASRNGHESVTGLMLYDNAHFFQWLEGPEDGVDRVMGSIYKDPRHTEIEVLHKRPVKARTFGDWQMKLATADTHAAPWYDTFIRPPREVVDGLRENPKAAPDLLVKLVSRSGEATHQSTADAISRMKLHPKTADILRNVFLAAVMPRVGTGRRAGSTRATPVADPRAAELAELLIATDQAAAADLLHELRAGEHAVAPLSAALFEPAARRLGDLWGEDLCSEFDVTLGLCRLQTAVRLLGMESLPKLPALAARPIVLIAPEPGELHRLGAALDGEVLQDAGWSPQCEYPSNDQGLDDLLSSTWIDVLDLSLSAAFRREHWLPRVTRTIAEARRASLNPALVVVVGGRVFLETKTAGPAVGADRATTTSFNVNKTILQTISAAKTKTPTAGIETLPTPS